MALQFLQPLLAQSSTCSPHSVWPCAEQSHHAKTSTSEQWLRSLEKDPGCPSGLHRRHFHCVHGHVTHHYVCSSDASATSSHVCQHWQSELGLRGTNDGPDTSSNCSGLWTCIRAACSSTITKWQSTVLTYHWIMHTCNRGREPAVSVMLLCLIDV